MTFGRPSLLLALLTVLVAGPAAAEHDPFTRGFDAIPNKLTPTHRGGITVDGALPGRLHGLRLGLFGDLSFGALSLYEGDAKTGELIPFRADLQLLGAYLIHPRLELAAALPLTVYQLDNFQLLRDQGFPQPGLAAFTLGDVRLAPRAFILFPDQAPVGLAVIPEVRLPTGDGDSFTGDRGVVFAPRVAIERAFGPLRLLGNVGARFRTHGQFLNLYVGNEYTLGAAAVLKLPDLGPLREVQAIGELSLSTPMDAPFTFSQAASLKSPFEVLVGARARVSRRWSVELDVGRGVTVAGGYGREALRIIGGLRYSLDPQDDDQDGDGVPDGQDRCPTEREDEDGFQDDDGCPEPDNDGDGLFDGQDSCPNEAGARWLDGCPDRDNDDIPDPVDRCPDQPGDAELEGCEDAAPPLVVLESDRIRIRGNVRFEVGEARIQKRSYPILDEVAALLLEHPQLGPVLIEGHTDNRGSRSVNLDLSDRRAKAVMDYLIKKGIDAKRLRAQGFGFDRPVATNDTALGRARNRRVEFRLMRPEGSEGDGSEAETPKK